MKKIFVSILIVSILQFSTIANVFAVKEEPFDDLILEEVLQMENILGTEDVVNTIIEKNNYYQPLDNNNLQIPMKGDGKVMLNINGNRIITNLPDEVEKERGVIHSHETVAFLSKDNPVGVMIQALKHKDNNAINAVRMMVMLRNNSAPREYSFEFDLPNGYYLTFDYDYNMEDSEFANSNCGAVYIVDENDEIVTTIDPAWAKDAKGNSIDSFYKISGNSLIQVIDYDSDSLFPIIADPTEHPTIYEYRYLTKANVKTIRNQYTNTSVQTIIDAIGQIVNDMLNGEILSTAWHLINLVATNYNVTQYNAWNKIYTNFEKKYAKIAFPYAWHSGHRSYYPHGTLKCTYTYSH